MGKSDRTEKREAIRTAEKGKHTGEIVPLSAGKQTAAKTVSKEEQAQERFERIVEQMKQAQGITEQLKADNAWEWVGRMNNIQACAREIVNVELIFR